MVLFMPVHYCLILAMLLPFVATAEKVLLDFEKNRDVNMWDVVSGKALELSAQPVLNGKGAMVST